MMHAVVALVDFCRRRAWLVVAAFLAASVFCGWFAASNFRMNTDVNTLLAEDLPWRQQEKAIEQAFPGRTDLLVVVIDGTNAVRTETAAAALFERMAARPDLFKSTRRPDALPFFRQNGLLFLEQAELADTVDRIMQAQPMLASLAADQSLRGLFKVFALVFEGIDRGEARPEQFLPAFHALTRAAQSVAAGHPEQLDWQALMNDGKPDSRGLRRFILTQPKLDYGALSPGAAAGQAVRTMIRDLKLDAEPGLKVRLTGSVALNDEEFASVAEGMQAALLGSLILVGVLLFLALRSIRIVMPILLTLAVGLVMTTAFGIAAIGALNLISVAFAVMFIGIAVDFGIQFGVRFRDQFFHHPEHAAALQATARIIAQPLILAGVSTAAGFLAFTPTDYAGVAELGLIAGGGMIIALICNLMLLPALIAIAKPPPEREAVGFRWAAPLDTFLQHRRRGVMVVAALLALISIGIITQLRFDFDPLNLKDKKTESVATLFDLAKNLESTPYTAQILSKDITTADALAARIKELPEVARVMTLSSFVPDAQDSKLQILNDTRMILTATLTPTDFASPPRDTELLQATQYFLGALDKRRASLPVAGELADALRPIARNTDKIFALQNAALSGLSPQLITIRDLLMAQPVTLESLPAALRDDWMTADGRARIEIYPQGNPRDPETLLRFNQALKDIAPEVSGTTIAIAESGATVVTAFIKAALGAIAVITVLLLLSLRRIFDSLALLTPLVLAGLLTLATSVLLQIPINFANIIGLPLLLGLGVSFAIYFVTYWRSGGTSPLQSSMARAVTFSASTTLVAFGALAMSSHPGTASMGEILTIALLYSLLCTCFLLPALLGRYKQN
ncbi:MAG: MMPL family transporter [Alphaproteobacteria bacterium]